MHGEDHPLIQFIKRLWGSAPIATLVLIASLMVAGGFAVRSVAFWIYWNDPAHRAQAIEPWMTPKYIAHSWDVPLDVVIEALGDVPRPPKSPMGLDQIANIQQISPDTLIVDVEAAIQTFKIKRRDSHKKGAHSKTQKGDHDR